MPIYFQAVKGSTALKSGIQNIPRILANVLTIILSGAGVGKWGYYNPFIYASVVLSSIGAGLLMTLTPDTGAGKWIGYQILYGIGSGMGFQQPPNAAQAVLSMADMPTGIAITLFFRHFGAALFINVGNNVLNSELLSGLSARALPGVDAQEVLDLGATSFRTAVPAQYVGAVVDVYSHAIQKTFEVGLIISCLSAIGACFIEWRSMKTRPKPSSPPSDNGEAEKSENASSV